MKVLEYQKQTAGRERGKGVLDAMKAQLGEVASIVRGISFPKEDKRSESLSEHVACLRTSNVQRTVEWDDLWFVPEKYVKREEQIVRPGDILISTANSYELVGKVAHVGVMPFKATLGAFISLIRPNDGVDPKFLYHQLAWGKTQSRIRETASTTTNLSNVSTKKLLTLDLYIPPLKVQREIVAEIEKQFSRLDEAVANLQRVKANLKRYKAAVLKAAVEGRLVETEASIARREGRNYETGEQLLQTTLEARKEQWVGGKYKAPEPPQVSDVALPAGWAWATLEQLHLQIADVDHKMPKAKASGIPYISTKDFFGDEGIDFSKAKLISAEDYKALCRKVKPERGDLLLSRYGTVGEVREVSVDEPFQASYSVAILKPVRGLVPIRFLIAALRSDVVQRQIKRDVRATAQPDLGLAHIRQFVVPVPPMAEQLRILEELDRQLSILRGIEAEVENNMMRAQNLRQSTLSKAFTDGVLNG